MGFLAWLRIVGGLLVGMALLAQSRVVRHDAGVDGSGDGLAVIETTRGSCSRWVLERSRAGQVVSRATVVRMCADDGPVESGVHVGPNWIEVGLNGGSQAGFFQTRRFQLSPWRALWQEDCQFTMSGEHTLETWNYRTLRGEAWHLPGGKDSNAGVCEAAPDQFHYLVVPRVEVTGVVERVGSCALRLAPLAVRVVRLGTRVVLVDGGTAGDEVDVWMGSRLGGPMWGFRIPVGSGPVVSLGGAPAALPAVTRRTTARGSVLLSVELPAPPDEYSTGFTVAYHVGRTGRVVSTSAVTPGDGSTMAAGGSALADNDVANYVTCAVVNGALEITGGRPAPLVFPERH